jgi:phage protein
MLVTAAEKLEQEAYEQNVPVDYVKFKSDCLHGLYIDGSIAIRSGLSSAQTADTLAEELEHHYTSYGNILDLNDPACRKQEHLARLRAYDRRVGLSGIILGYRNHCHNLHELAECLEVSEGFLNEALECYREKYGCYTELDGYVIMFEPHLAVMEKI